MVSSGIANTAQSWDKGDRSFVKAAFNASQENLKKPKVQLTKQKKKEKDPTLLQKQVLAKGKTTALYCATAVNLAFAGVVIPYEALDFDNFPFSHLPKFPQKQIYGTGMPSPSWHLSD